MTTHQEYLKQIEELRVKAEQARIQETQAAVNQIRQIMAENGLSVSDLSFEKKSKTKAPKQKSAAQFRDPENSANTWSGRGRMPAWMKGQDKEKFRM